MCSLHPLRHMHATRNICFLPRGSMGSHFLRWCHASAPTLTSLSVEPPSNTFSSTQHDLTLAHTELRASVNTTVHGETLKRRNPSDSASGHAAPSLEWLSAQFSHAGMYSNQVSSHAHMSKMDDEGASVQDQITRITLHHAEQQWRVINETNDLPAAQKRNTPHDANGNRERFANCDRIGVHLEGFSQKPSSSSIWAENSEHAPNLNPRSGS